MERLRNVYGSNMGLLKLFTATCFLRAGAFRRFNQVDFSRVQRLVFVCKGNICRSAYAEALARRQCAMAVASCGIEASPGAPADARIQLAADRRGIALDSHESRIFSAGLCQEADLFVGMEAWHVDAVEPCLNGAQVTLLGLWSDPQRAYLHDPFSASDGYMEYCMNVIESGVMALIQRVQSVQRSRGDEPIRQGS